MEQDTNSQREERFEKYALEQVTRRLVQSVKEEFAKQEIVRTSSHAPTSLGISKEKSSTGLSRKTYSEAIEAMNKYLKSNNMS